MYMKAGPVETCRQELPFSGNMLCKRLQLLSAAMQSTCVAIFCFFVVLYKAIYHVSLLYKNGSFGT